MRYAILSDLHANASALKAVVADAKGEGVETFVCLGDIVGYGPSPAETLAEARRACSIAVAGNHDDAVSGRIDADDFIDLAGDAVARHRKALPRDGIAYLRSLPHVALLDGATAVHGDLTAPEEFRYVDSADSAAENFAAADFKLLFAGHTHVPEIYLTGGSGATYRIDPQDFAIEEGKRYIVNPGSVGYPRERDGRCLSSYVIYDSGEGTVSYRFLPFAVSSVMQRGREPRGARWKALAAAAAALTAAAVAAVALSVRREAAEATKAEAVVAVEKRSLTIPPSAKFVKANLKLDRRHDPVKLYTSFRRADGSPCGTQIVSYVSRSSANKIKIPADAAHAEFEARPISPGSRPVVLSFSPEALP